MRLSRTLRYGLSLTAILLLNFSLPRLMPGNPVVHLIGVEDYYRYPELAAGLREKFGLDRPPHIQFARYIGRLCAGDLGYSFRYSRPVGGIVLHRLKWTLVLVLPALLLGAVLAAVLGAVSGWCRGRPWERLLTLGLLCVKSVPHYGLAMLALLLLAFKLRLFPLAGASGHASGFAHALLPVLLLGLFNAAHYHLLVRNTTADIKTRPFIAAARARGLSENTLLFRHAFPNAALPFLTLLGLGFSVSGALLVEIVFSWPGMGTLILSAVESRDYPLLQACFLLLTLTVLVANYATDLVYGLCDPRTRR